MVDSLRGLLAAPRCLLCQGRSHERICGACWSDLPWNRVACPRCALPLGADSPHLCRRCSRRTPPFDAAIAAFRYAAPIDLAVHRLKYGADFLAARWLGEALAAAVSHGRGTPLPEMLIPVPLHGNRLRRRGYNQAQECARVVADSLNLTLRPRLAQRLRATEDQIGKTAAQRQRNLRGAFAVDALVIHRHIAILDDVMTTGSTAAELARACRRAGAAHIEVWAIARTE